MKPYVVRGQTANIGFVFIPDTTSTTGAGKTGLTNASSGLKIAVRREKSSAVTAYSGANIGSITTLGTWVDPTSGKVNFKEVDATNMPGLYEIHWEDAILGTSDTSRKLIGLATVTGGAPTPFEIPLSGADLQDGVRLGLTALPNATAGANGGVPALDSNLRVASNLGAVNGDATAAANLAKTTRAIVRGTVGSSATTTSIPTSALTPADSVTAQFKGRIITFDADTATAALRGQSTDITNTNGSGTLSVTALTTAPASGDTFSIT